MRGIRRGDGADDDGDADARRAVEDDIVNDLDGEDEFAGGQVGVVGVRRGDRYGDLPRFAKGGGERQHIAVIAGEDDLRRRRLRE